MPTAFSWVEINIRLPFLVEMEVRALMNEVVEPKASAEPAALHSPEELRPCWVNGDAAFAAERQTSKPPLAFWVPKYLEA